MKGDIANLKALRFVIFLGFVSLLADVTYEGARSINGPYLAMLGASATLVGFVSGFGEFLGYGLRLVSGVLSDRTQKYWAITIVGYAINLVAVPLMAFAGDWKTAALLIIAERTGKAIRTPARDAMLSHAAAQMGLGWGFGLHKAMDQIGAMLGPLVVASVLFRTGVYGSCYAVLFIPALLALALLLAARFLYPRPRDLEMEVPRFESKGFSNAFWLYLAAAALIAAGYADFPLVAYHFEKASALPKVMIPVFYSVAMGAESIAALVFGRLFDRHGMVVLMGVSFLSAFFAPLVFLGGFWMALSGMALWGVGMGAQDSVMRAAVAGMVSSDRRGTAFGIFNAGYGLFWFLGSVLIGFLYDRSLPLMILFSVGIQWAAVPLFFMVRSRQVR